MQASTVIKYLLFARKFIPNFKAPQMSMVCKQLLIGWVILLITVSVNAATEQYPFTSSQQQADFNRLTHDMRCLVCQNQDLADSNAPLAVDLRNEIYQQVKQGRTRQEIIDYMTVRYGDFVLYKPPFKSLTYVLWLAPFVVLVLSLGSLIIIVKRRSVQGKDK